MVLLEFENWGFAIWPNLLWLNENGLSCNCCVYGSIGFGIFEMLILNLWIFLLILISLPKSIHFLFLTFFHWNRTISWIIISQFEVCHNGSVWLVYDILCMIVKLIFWERIKKRGFQGKQLIKEKKKYLYMLRGIWRSLPKSLRAFDLVEAELCKETKTSHYIHFIWCLLQKFLFTKLHSQL